jgi:uncharacterized protein YbjT (DUF2867 family)
LSRRIRAAWINDSHKYYHSVFRSLPFTISAQDTTPIMPALTITIFPASTQAARYTISSLLSLPSPPEIRAIYRDTSKAPAAFTGNDHLTVIKGDVSTGEGLDFTGSDAVFYIPPPTYDGTDSAVFAQRAAENVKTAVQKASSVKRLVLLSAMGAQHDSGIGILVVNHVTDEILGDAAEEVVIVRPGFFMESWATALQTAKEDGKFEWIFTPKEHEIAMVSQDPMVVMGVC